jgi:asparagine synthase (glutamine-hydrolysing)
MSGERCRHGGAMNGICGILVRNKADHLNAMAVLRMLGALDPSRRGESCIPRLGGVGLGAVGLPGRLTGVVEAAVHERPLAMAFHGNLYNLGELSHIEERGAHPLTGLLRLYQKEGTAFLRRLRGEFALALWDGQEETLYLATDRFRIHPLLYYQDQHRLLFASSMKAILACPLPVRCTVNPEAIVDVLAFSAIPTPKTIFREVAKLPPGHLLSYRNGAIRLTPYWDMDFRQCDGADEATLARKLKAYFTDAVAVRLAVDKDPDRIGTFLSGGVDSSAVTGVLTQLAKRPMKSFSIGFDEEQFNEISYARIAARAFGAEHYEYYVTPQDVDAVLPIVLEAFDEPFANASAVPTYFCARMAREHGVEVLYAGDGGDELFAGNERYATQRLFEYYSKIPAWLRESFVKPLVFGMAEALKWDLLMRGKKYIQRASIPYPERLSSYGFFKVVPTTALLADDLLESVGKTYDPYAPMSVYYHQAPACSELDRQLYIDLKLAIADNDLLKVTRMSEAAGVTVRFPFLDHRLAEFAATIPARVKMRGRRLRSFFKMAYADLLPRETRSKKKHGFGLPIPIWLRTDKRLNEMLRDLLLSPRAVLHGYFRTQALEELIERHKTDETSFYGTALWTLMILELWHRHYQDGIR